MRVRRPISIFGIILALFVGLGMTLSAVQASNMAVKMATSSTGSPSGVVGCDFCGVGDDDGTDVNLCVPGCLSTGPVIVPIVTMVHVIQREAGTLVKETSPSGLSEIPDPSPPKPLTIA